ncbi:helix-turn-helix domain-containing protein [Sphingobium sp. DC-2]|uniref:winged helix-turn-helix transcriptional regulator n=1 Tax=Sphingobium sp. DC-2 TaxID=1303256 RepID=UPI0004C36922|nr:helix-turn-helix domain-containing protein [Sphingobium sp. DC-2]
MKSPSQHSNSTPLSTALREGDLMAVACPSREIFRHITSRWGAMVILALEVRTYRFSELRRRIGGVSERMLAHTLHLLEGNHLILRQAHAVVPPHVDYSLTDLGREAAILLRPLADWVESNVHRMIGDGNGVAGEIYPRAGKSN